jgi:hypothetical protein
VDVLSPTASPTAQRFACLCTEPVRAARPTEVLGAEGIFMREEQEAGTVVHRELLKVTLRILRAAR